MTKLNLKGPIITVPTMAVILSLAIGQLVLEPKLYLKLGLAKRRSYDAAISMFGTVQGSLMQKFILLL